MGKVSGGIIVIMVGVVSTVSDPGIGGKKYRYNNRRPNEISKTAPKIEEPRIFG